MRGIVGTVWDRVMYAGDYAADGLSSAVSSAWGLCHAGRAMLVSTIGRSVESCWKWDHGSCRVE